MSFFWSSAATSSDFGRRAAEVLQQVVQREARVHDVLDQQDIAALELVVEVLEDAHDARGLRGRAVGGDGHEVELERQPDVPREVGHHHEGALEDPDEQQLAAGVVGRDALAHLPQLALDLLGGDQDAVDVGFVGLHVSRQCRDGSAGAIGDGQRRSSSIRSGRSALGGRASEVNIRPASTGPQSCREGTLAARPAGRQVQDGLDVGTGRPVTPERVRGPAAPPGRRSPAARPRAPAARSSTVGRDRRAHQVGEPVEGRLGLPRQLRVVLAQERAGTREGARARPGRSPARGPAGRGAGSRCAGTGDRGSSGPSAAAARATGRTPPSPNAGRRAAAAPTGRSTGGIPAAPAAPAPRQHPHQDGLGLIVEGVAGRDRGGRHLPGDGERGGSPLLARPRLDRVPRAGRPTASTCSKGRRRAGAARRRT